MTKRSWFTAAVCSATVAGFGASTALAGEITGNGTLKPVNGKSACAYSGQEDLQWYVDDENTQARTDPTKGDPAHAQSWGQIPKAVRDSLPAELHPGMACNPTKSTFGD